jgi:hypothetical protein
MADNKSKYQEVEDSKKELLDKIKTGEARRFSIADQVKAAELQKDFASELDPATLRLFELDSKDLKENTDKLEVELQASTEDIITATDAGYRVSGNLRYSNLLFKPLYDYPRNSMPSKDSSGDPIELSNILWVQFASVTIYAHTPSAPEFGIVDQLILVTDTTDTYGFEETPGVFSTSTTTFNTYVNQGNLVREVRLDRRIFDRGCYSQKRIYRLTYASGHWENIEVHPPSPCHQGFSLYVDTSNVNYAGWEHSYCSSEDYKSKYIVSAGSNPITINPYQNIVRCIPHNSGNGPTETKFPGSAENAKGLLSSGYSFSYNASTDREGAIPTKGDCAVEAQEASGLVPDNYINGNTEYGSPLQIEPSQVSRLDHVIIGDRGSIQASGMEGISPYTGLRYIQDSFSWFANIEDEGQQSLMDSEEIEMMPPEGYYGVIREYSYSENLVACIPGSPPKVEVCLDSKSPSYYLTTEVDCSGTSITDFIDGTNGPWEPMAGPEGCCGVDCSDFLIGAYSTEASFGGSDGTIVVDFTNGGGAPSGTPNSSNSAYTVSLTHSSGSSITQNGNSAYVIGAIISDSTCDTVAGSSIVTCSPASAIFTVGMEVSGLGIDGTAYIGAITGGQPGAVTEFQLSSSPRSNIPVNANSTQSNPNLKLVVGEYAFVWGSLPPTYGSDYYELSITDDNGCVYTQVFSISEGAESSGCLDVTAINYSASYNSQCVPDCCMICDAIKGYIENANGSFLGNPFTSLNTSSLAATTSVASDGTATLNGGLSPSLLAYLVSTMSYQYTLHALTSSGDFDSAGAILATTTSTLGQGITSNFTGLGYGYYAIQVQIEDSATGADANLENCFQWVAVDVLANVCQDPSATNTNSTVPYDLAIPNESICIFDGGCDCAITITTIADECGIRLRANISCSTAGPISWRWIHPNGDVLFEESFPYVLPTSFVDFLNSNLITESGTYVFEFTDGGGSGSCVTVVTENVSLPVCGCMVSTAINFNPLATVDNNSCVYCQYGCTDPAATNYDSSATCDDGSCFTPYGGCTDSTASNYDPTANVDDGSCLFRGCMDQTASNYLHSCEGVYNPNINENSPQCCIYCVAPVFSEVVVTNASIQSDCATNSDGRATTTAPSTDTAQLYGWTVFNNLGATVYEISGVELGDEVDTGAILPAGVYTHVITDSNGCTANGVFVIGSDSSGCGCMDPDAFNYDVTATTDDGSCHREGCTDPNATNYNPNTTIDDGSCSYTIASNPCQLTTVTQEKIDSKIFGCLTLKGAMYLNKIRIGYSDDCSVMNQWKLILVNYLLHKKELDCMYNCSDDMTPQPTGPSTCGELWVTGGSRTGVNDQGHAGSTITSGGGTLITDPDLYFVSGNILSQGDVIKMPSGLIWELISTTDCDSGCYDPEFRGSNETKWSQCTSLSNFTNTTTTNYLDPFIRFMNEQCDRCTEDPKCTEAAIARLR